MSKEGPVGVEGQAEIQQVVNPCAGEIGLCRVFADHIALKDTD